LFRSSDIRAPAVTSTFETAKSRSPGRRRCSHHWPSTQSNTQIWMGAVRRPSSGTRRTWTSRITQQTIDFWTDLVDEELDEREIRWTDGEYRIFQKIVHSMGSKKGFNVAVDLSPGQGTLSQTVQVPKWRIDRSCEWFTMGDVSEYMYISYVVLTNLLFDW
jgi:hypothetical protein